jgi:hypothetical protein
MVRSAAKRRQVYAACAGLAARVSNHVFADARAKLCAAVRSKRSFETPAARAPQDEDQYNKCGDAARLRLCLKMLYFVAFSNGETGIHPRIKSEGMLRLKILYFVAFSDGEPVSTSAENALAVQKM